MGRDKVRGREKTGGMGQMREGTEEGGKGREVRRDRRGRKDIREGEKWKGRGEILPPRHFKNLAPVPCEILYFFH